MGSHDDDDEEKEKEVDGSMAGSIIRPMVEKGAQMRRAASHASQ